MSDPHVPLGWICARCQASNAPFVERCNCQPRPRHSHADVLAAVERLWPESGPLPLPESSGRRKP